MTLIFNLSSVYSIFGLISTENLPIFSHFSDQLVLLIKEKNSYEPHVNNIYLSIKGTDDLNFLNSIVKRIHEKCGLENNFIFSKNYEVNESSFVSWPPKYSLHIQFLDKRSMVSFF